MVDFIVLGIGVNINMTTEEINNEMGTVAHTATSLKVELGKDINRSKFAADLLLELENWYQIFINNGKAKVLAQWTKTWGDLNKRVQVRIQDHEPYEGTAIGIDERGYLMVKTDEGGINKIIAGDVIVL